MALNLVGSHISCGVWQMVGLRWVPPTGPERKPKLIDLYEAYTYECGRQGRSGGMGALLLSDALAFQRFPTLIAELNDAKDIIYTSPVFRNPNSGNQIQILTWFPDRRKIYDALEAAGPIYAPTLAAAKKMKWDECENLTVEGDKLYGT